MTETEETVTLTRIFCLRTTIGQEQNVARLIEARARCTVPLTEFSDLSSFCLPRPSLQNQQQHQDDHQITFSS